MDALLDEDTAARLDDRLSNRGHDVQRVVDVDELGPGTDDDVVLWYAMQAERVIVTYDEGFFQRLQGQSGPLRLMWITDQQRFRPDEEATMIENALDILNGDLHAVGAALPLDGRYLY